MILPSPVTSLHLVETPSSDGAAVTRVAHSQSVAPRGRRLRRAIATAAGCTGAALIGVSLPCVGHGRRTAEVDGMYWTQVVASAHSMHGCSLSDTVHGAGKASVTSK